MFRLHLLVIILPLILLTAPAHPTSSSPLCRRQQLADVLHRLANLVDFFATDPGRVNADGYFGLRVSRDLLADTGARLGDISPCWDGHRGLLNSILTRQGLLVRQVRHQLTRKSRYDVITYAKICQPLLRLLRQLIRGTGWRAHRLRSAVQQQQQQQQQLRHSTPAEPMSSISEAGSASVGAFVSWLAEYEEPKGDACLMQALRSGDSVCSTSEATCSYFAQPIAKSSGYYLTHQLIYKLAIALRCSTAYLPKSKQAAVTAAAGEIAASCNKIFAEFKQIERANWTQFALETDDDMVTGLRDLYIEQAFLCGLLGDARFYGKESLDTVASWQDPELGCFKIFNGNLGAQQISPILSGFSRRRILRDVAMLGGCSSHTSGIAMTFYANAVQFLTAIKG